MAATASTPRHFWPVALLSLLWNAFGGYDFVMTNMRDAAYLAQFPPEMMDYIDIMPLWAIGAWTLGVGGGVLGSLMLLARSRFAVHAFAASLAGLALSTVYQISVKVPAAMTSAPMLVMTAAIWIVAVFLLWYACWMRKAGVLR